MLFWLSLRFTSNYFYAKLSKHVTLSYRNSFSGIVQGSSHNMNLRCLNSRSSTRKTTPECAENTIAPALDKKTTTFPLIVCGSMLSCVLRTRFDFANRNARHDVASYKPVCWTSVPTSHPIIHLIADGTSLLGSRQEHREVCKAPYSFSAVFFVVICVILLDVELYWCIAGIVLLVAQ
jgi:hypothetical protein